MWRVTPQILGRGERISQGVLTRVIHRNAWSPLIGLYSTSFHPPLRRFSLRRRLVDLEDLSSHSRSNGGSTSLARASRAVVGKRVSEFFAKYRKALWQQEQRRQRYEHPREAGTGTSGNGGDGTSRVGSSSSGSGSGSSHEVMHVSEEPVELVGAEHTMLAAVQFLQLFGLDLLEIQRIARLEPLVRLAAIVSCHSTLFLAFNVDASRNACSIITFCFLSHFLCHTSDIVYSTPFSY